MPTSCWLIGSLPNMTGQSFTVTANAVAESVSVSAGDYYLFDGVSSSFSAMIALRSALNSHSEIGNAQVTLRRDRLVQITLDVTGTINWLNCPTLAAMLGFSTVAGSPTLTHVADTVSPYLWSPGKIESPAARLGSDGFPYYDTQVGQSGTNVVVATTNNTGIRNSFEWNVVAMDKVWTNPDTNGTHKVFWDTVLRNFYQFKLWRNVTEDETSATVSLSEKIPSSGAYIMVPDRGNVQYNLTRTLQYVEALADLKLDVVRVPEYT